MGRAQTRERARDAVQRGPYLWKTETQLRGPDNHFAWYLVKSGFTDSRKGPMKGVFHAGPTIEPLFQRYLTAARSAMFGVGTTARGGDGRTLVVGNGREQQRQDKLPHRETGDKRGKEAIGVELLQHVGNAGVCRGRDEARVERHWRMLSRARGAGGWVEREWWWLGSPGEKKG